ncbi:sensor histidine kinase [Paenibacillus kobensis]|uniref:sensor histidine kinase n=1 Tax=Paenibacillus kobensis TaxID=59841 RepID=UPI000FD99D56|nr:HAMP domain-containing sensor histidine kinase [Paenibacillus kobensis]
MSIRIRLLLSYLVMLIVPLVLLSIAAIILLFTVLGDLSSVFTLDTTNKNPVAAVIGEEADIAADIRDRIDHNPESLLDGTLQQSYDNRLNKINMGLVVRMDDQIHYTSRNLQETKVAAHLPPYEDSVVSEPKTMIVDLGDNDWVLDRQYNFELNGAKGSYYLLFNLDFVGFLLAKFSKMFLITLLIILAVVNGILTYFVSRSIIRPLRKLQRAAEQIKEGNLTAPVVPESKDEIGTLAASFEAMRVRLKESVELQLQYEDNRKSLVSNITHDLKSPVAAIRAYVEGIMDGVASTPEMLDQYVKTIHRKAVHMDRLIDELFLFSKLDLKGLPFHYEQVDLASFLADCAEELQLDVEKQGVKLEYKPAVKQGTAIVTADRDKLKRVMVNIIENAVKYSDKADGGVWIELKETDERYDIVVKDNGKGISPEALPFIFDRFYRADTSRNVDTGGSGLGLAIARHIVEEHGGTITAASEPGIGTVIMITLRKPTDRGLAAG